VQYSGNDPLAMLTTSDIGLRDVLVRRRGQVGVRVGSALLLMFNNGPMVGWLEMGVLTGLYCALQALEFFVLCKEQPKQRANWVVLVVLALSTMLFGAQAPLLAMKLGSWGLVCGIYLLCAAVTNAVFLTIGCRAAFLALTIPCLTYLAVLPFMPLLRHQMPTYLIFFELSLGGLYFILNIVQLWGTGSRGKLAELQAVRRYVAARDAHVAKLFRLTQHDALTGLLNRDALRARLTDCATSHTAAALLILDLDGFKYVNDTLGHGAGDDMLRIVSMRLRQAAREEDTAARLGGDEFALLLNGVAEPEVAMTVAQRLISEISQPVMLDGQPINIGVSAGVAIYPRHGGEAGQIFANADLALYQAKSEGRHCARLYDTSLRAMAQSKVLRDTELRLALERGEFEMFYQPQLRLSDNTLVGAEALLRWRHPVRGLLPPTEFLPALEGGPLGAKVGTWVIETACKQAAIWRSGLAPDFRIAVNLFGMQFRSGDLPAWVMAALNKAGLPPHALEIEITENVILRHEDDVIEPLRELRGLGVGVAFDDYGTGFASLSMLTRYPVSRLKIDRAFTHAICDSPAEAAIVRAVLTLAGALGLQVTAEGVETQAQLHMLRAQGCDEAQGYYFGKPMSADDFCLHFGTQACPCSACPVEPERNRKCPARRETPAYAV
jgi:diguanylate cyclase (GGDEF)-like protein